MLEIACFNVESAMIAADTGADRIEFCSHYECGGLTPQLSDFETIRRQINQPIFIIIRPKRGNFRYTSKQMDEMVKSIHQFKNAGADGFVFGCLNDENEVAIDQNKKLIEAASPLPCTFHRAFDRTKNWQKSLNEIIDLGFKNILTAGLSKNAVAGIPHLQKIKQLAEGKIEIIAGGGIRAENLELIKKETGLSHFHSSGIVNGDLANVLEIKLMAGKLK